MVKFIHCADLHLGATFKSISAKCSHEVKTLIVNSTFSSWQQLVAKAVDAKVDFVLISGDIFDNPNPLLRVRMLFKEGIDKLLKNSIRVFIVSGNHDNNIELFKEFNFPETVKIFSADSVENFVSDELKVVVSGISYHGDNAKENLSKLFNANGLNQNYFKIALLHANIGGVTTYDENYGFYSSCNLGDLSSQNFDYWALGHIHNGAILRDEKPYAVYPGSLQGLNINQDTPKGAYLVEVDDNLKIKMTFLDCATVGFARKEIDFSSVASDSDFLRKIEDAASELSKKFNSSELIFTEFIFVGRSAYYGKLRKELVSEIMRTISAVLGNKFFLNDLQIKLLPIIDNERILKNNPLLGDILSVDENGENGKEFLEGKIQQVRNKFSLMDSFSEEEIADIIKMSKNDLYCFFAEGDE